MLPVDMKVSPGVRFSNIIVFWHLSDNEATTEYLFVVVAQDQATNETDRKTTTVTVYVYLDD